MNLTLNQLLAVSTNVLVIGYCSEADFKLWRDSWNLEVRLIWNGTVHERAIEKFEGGITYRLIEQRRLHAIPHDAA
jgi:hypothetical protein